MSEKRQIPAQYDPSLKVELPPYLREAALQTDLLKIGFRHEIREGTEGSSPAFLKPKRKTGYGPTPPKP